MRKKAELVSLYVLHAAVAAALKQEIHNRAATAFEEEGSADTWRTSAATVSGSLSQDTTVIVSESALIEWLERNYPEQVETITVKRIRSQKWLQELLNDTLEPADPASACPGETTPLITDEGEVVPGVVWWAGGLYLNTTVRRERAARQAAEEIAAAYAAGQIDILKDGATLPH